MSTHRSALRSRTTYLKVRRVVDVAAVLVASPIVIPAIALTALVIRRVSPGPVFFRQRRPGYHGCEFELIKLRTMSSMSHADASNARVERSDGNEELTTIEDARTTPITRWIRRHRLDELPQLWHVLTGEMGLIGPRPVPAGIAATMAAIAPDYARRLMVRPGLTGLAQVRLGYTDDIEGEQRKLAYDLTYLDTVSPILDLKILAATVRVVLHGTGGR